MFKLILSFLLYITLCSKSLSQAFPFVNEHDNTKELKSCIIITQKVSPDDSLCLSLDNIWEAIDSKQNEIHSFLLKLNYHLDSIEVSSPTIDSDSLKFTAISRHYKSKGKNHKSFTIRKICLFFDSTSSNCVESPNFFWATPLNFSSSNMHEYILLKKDILNSSSGFKLNSCTLVHGGRNRIWYIAEVFQNDTYIIEFQANCKKAKEEKDGFHCKKCFGYEMRVSYTEKGIKEKLNK